MTSTSATEIEFLLQKPALQEKYENHQWVHLKFSSVKLTGMGGQ